jgi:hypothetical protein
MLYKKLRNMLIGLLLIASVFVGGGFYFNKPHSNTFKAKANQEYKIDLTQFKIKQILNTDQMQSLTVTFSAEISEVTFDNPGFKCFTGISKFFTSRKLQISADYKALFTYDLSKAQFTDNKNGTYTIVLNANDIENYVTQIDTPKTHEMMSIIGRYYDSKTVAADTYKLQTIASKKVNTYENRTKAIENTKTNLLGLFKNVGINTDKINIIIGGNK